MAFTFFEIDYVLYCTNGTVIPRFEYLMLVWIIKNSKL